jgi:nucleoside-diphosphate-sugar epimerase
MTRRVLVSGACGLLGGVLVGKLIDLGLDVVATSRRCVDRTAGGYVHRQCELADAASTRELFADGFDAIVHAAGRIRCDGADIAPFVRDNLLATANLVDAAMLARTRVFVFISTISVYSGDGPFLEDDQTNATDAYGWSKRIAERLCLTALGDRAVVLRLGGLHGLPRRDGVVYEFFARALRGSPIEVTEPETRVTLTFIDDAIAAIARVLEVPTPAPSRIYNVATVEAPSYRELAERVRDSLGSLSVVVSPVAPRRRDRTLQTARIRSELAFVPLPLSEHLARFARGDLERA